MDGVRKCLSDEFSNIYILNLRGDIRKNMLSKGRALEGGNIFASGSMASIAISLLVKNPKSQSHGEIYYHDIGDDLSREKKLERIIDFSSIAGIPMWQRIIPDDHGDWLKQRDDGFSKFIVLGNKKSDEPALFESYSLGVSTNRDAWVYNAGQRNLISNVKNMIGFYNSEVIRFATAHSGLSTSAVMEKVDSFIDTDPEKFSWTVNVKQELSRGRTFEFSSSHVKPSLYRPFTKQWMYFNRAFNERVLQMPKIFPQEGGENLVICIAGIGARAGFSALMANSLVNLHTLDTAQCFPLYLYDGVAVKEAGEQHSLLTSENQTTSFTRRDAISDAGLIHFQKNYPSDPITKEDIFYYVYGLLHSPDYRERYADNLSKELPRIPLVKMAADFWAFSKAGRGLAHWHLNYETVEPYPLTIDAKGVQSDADYRVEKMKFAKKGDKSTVIYNGKITLRAIPAEAWDYVVNGKAALDWVMERQSVKTDKASGIVNDANDWAIETMGNPKYPLELFQRVVTVSLETQKIVAALPKLDI